ncbi:MAG TPA: 5'-nucleotidase C-terminal domain-containing protein, partial [Euzebya sp.]|nr:5'-nucleotidase C-terminal domain-containing protein [Euzebya sp.]
PTNTAPDAPPVLDAIGLSLVGYDALALGNHDFDFGPQFTARFVDSFDPAVPFLSANLDVSGVPELQALADAEPPQVAPSVTVDAGGTPVGIIGLTTPFLRSISSPGDVIVGQDVVAAVQAEVDAMTAEGTEHIILISHLQGLSEDIDLVGAISGVDAVVAGGGDEVLADPADPLVPGDLANVADSYPIELTDADGETVPTVTTAGDYKYLGRLTLYFGEDGELLAETPFDEGTSRMVRLADESLPFGVARNATVVEEVEGPVRDFIADLETEVIATSEVDLDGSRPPIRGQETNLGNLVADAHAYIAETRGGDFGLDTTAEIVGLQNGGGIRNNSVIPAGDITELTTFEILPFANFVAAVEDFTADQLKDVLEQAYADVSGGNGAFLHVSNLVIEIDASQTAQEIEVDDEGQVTITTPGERVRSVTFADGTPLIQDGEVVEAAPTFTVASIDFSLRNGDGYPFNLGEDGFTVLGTSYQQALSSYIQAEAGLDGVISATDYPEGGEGRITITNNTDGE